MFSVLYHLLVFRGLWRKIPGLHLGSGPQVISGFYNLDANPAAASDILAGIERIKLASGTVCKIYNSHVFEHIPRARALSVLREWHRVLEPDGRLYICVPDLEALCKSYLDNLSRYDTQDGRDLVDLTTGIIYGGQVDKYDYHFFGYSYPTLKYLLHAAGFKEVRRFDRSRLLFAPKHDAAFARVGNMPVSLNVEAVK